MEYNEEPVYYCKACLSLHIVEEHGNDLCKNCGAINFVSVIPYEDYEKMIDEKDSELKS